MKIQKLFAVVASAAQAPSALTSRCFVGVKHASVSPRLVCRYVALGNTFAGETSTGVKCIDDDGLTLFEDDPGHSRSNPSFVYSHMTLHFNPEAWTPIMFYTAEYDYPCVYFGTNPSQHIEIYTCDKVEPPKVTTTTPITTTTASTATATTTPTTTIPTTLPASATCISNSKGKKNGNGYRGYCCSSNDDCYNSCVKGKRDGPAFPSSTVTATLSSGCTKGLQGKKNGKGTNIYCCYSDANCKESCINGICNKAKVILKPATTSPHYLSVPRVPKVSKRAMVSKTIVALPVMIVEIAASKANAIISRVLYSINYFV